MMAWRRLAREATATLRQGRVTAPVAAQPARSFSATCSSRATASTTPLGRAFLQNTWSRYSSPAARARAPHFGASLAARLALSGVRAQLPGLSSAIKGLGIGTVLMMMMLHQDTAAVATQDQQLEDTTGLPSKNLKNALIGLWPLVRKLQLPVGLVFLIVSGWRNPLGLVISVLLLVYASTPSRYSIYLSLQELRHRDMYQSDVVRKEEALHTRKVHTEDYKFFSIGTVELVDGTVLHLIGMLGSWWTYRVSHVE